MNSIHLKRCAIDLNFFKDGQIIWDKGILAPLGAYWETLNLKNRWGGNFKSLVDCPHFERNVG
jgi:peptidoglycan L-alanyl-D-glutamate endopeptidase CwlK